MVKNLPAVRENWVLSLGGEDPLEKGMATHSSILAWRIPWTEELGGLQTIGSQRVGRDWATNTHTHYNCVYLYIYLFVIKNSEPTKDIYIYIYVYIHACCCLWFSPYINRNWPQAHICPLSPELSPSSLTTRLLQVVSLTEHLLWVPMEFPLVIFWERPRTWKWKC